MSFILFLLGALNTWLSMIGGLTAPILFVLTILTALNIQVSLSVLGVMSSIIIISSALSGFCRGLLACNEEQLSLTNLASGSVILSFGYYVFTDLAALLSDLSGPFGVVEITGSPWLPTVGDLPPLFAVLAYNLFLPLFGIGIACGLCSWYSGILLCWRLLTNRNRQGPYRKRGRIWQVFVAVNYIIATLCWFRALALR